MVMRFQSPLVYILSTTFIVSVNLMGIMWSEDDIERSVDLFYV